jgi:DNA-binding SARP family transcriptional activator/tetratricopeptide (TPR) repeat protein
VEFRILGPLYADAGTGSGPAVVCQPLLQSALAVLLLRANRPCPRSLLIEALWGGEPPASPEAALRVCISRLRHHLGDCAARLDSVGPPGGRAPGHRQQRGYMMTVRPGELDVDEFTDLAAQGQTELDMGNAAAAAASLVQALALWGDPPLPDLPDSEVIGSAVARLKGQRQAAMDALIDARLAAGEHELVLGQLRATVAASPGRERPCAQLMRAYHELGMRMEALDVYQMARRATLEQQGAEPGPVLAVLYQRILAEEKATDSPAPQLTRFSLAAPMLPGSQVPAPPADFTGRSGEIARIVDSMTGPGVPVTVVIGWPGIGKTTVAAAAAMQLRDQFTDGQLYAELGGVELPRDPQDALADMLQTMGIPVRSVPSAGPPRAALFRSLLAGRKVLIIADDAATAAQVRPLIPAAGGAAVLVTSRSRLSGLAGVCIMELEALPRDDATTLLSAAAGPGRLGTDPAAADAIVTACAGLPLALRLAGARLAARPGLTAARLANDLEGGRALDMLAAEDTSVRATIGSSYRAVSSLARAALSIAATAMAGEIPAWALANVANGDTSITDQLAAAGLVAPAQPEIAGARYRLHPLIRVYAAECWHEQAECHNGALARLRADWLKRADRAAALLPALPFLAAAPPFRVQQSTDAAPDAGAGWLDSERVNLLAITEQACVAGDYQLAGELASRLMANQCIKGAYREAISTWRAIYASAAAAGDTPGEAKSGYYLAVALAEARDHVSEAFGLLGHCAPALEQGGEPSIAAMAYALLGRCASADCRHGAAIKAARHAVKLAGDGPSSELTRCCADSVIGLTLARVGIAGSGMCHLQRALGEARSLDQPAYEAHAIQGLAQALVITGQYNAAASLCGEGIRLATGIGSEITAARFMLVLGRAHQRSGDLTSAADSFLEAADVFGKAGLVIEEVTARSMLAASSSSVGDRLRAATQVADVAQILAGRGISDAEVKAEAAQFACE